MSIFEAGYALVPAVLTDEHINRLIELAPHWGGPLRGGARNLLNHAAIRALATSPALRSLIEPVLGPDCFCTHATYFDKHRMANWKVPWHQDLKIAVRERVDGAPGYSTWSVKAGVVHVQPPLAVLENILAARIHLDDCGPGNGPLRVRPGSHLAPEREEEVVCTARRGDVLLMRPLLMHASSAAVSPSHRRVIHLEYAVGGLPGGVTWHDRV